MGEPDKVDETLEEVPTTHRNRVQDLNSKYQESKEEFSKEVETVKNKCKT